MKVNVYLIKVNTFLKLNDFNPIDKIECSEGTSPTPGKHIRLFCSGRNNFFQDFFEGNELFTTEMESKLFQPFLVLRNNPDSKASTLTSDFELDDNIAKKSLRLLQNKCRQMGVIRKEIEREYESTCIELTNEHVTCSLCELWLQKQSPIELRLSYLSTHRTLDKELSASLESNHIEYYTLVNEAGNETDLFIKNPSKEWKDENSNLVQGLKDIIQMSQRSTPRV